MLCMFQATQGNPLPDSNVRRDPLDGPTIRPRVSRPTAKASWSIRSMICRPRRRSRDRTASCTRQKNGEKSVKIPTTISGERNSCSCEPCRYLKFPAPPRRRGYLAKIARFSVLVSGPNGIAQRILLVWRTPQNKVPTPCAGKLHPQ